MKECVNCGSPIAGYADTCGGLACNATLEPILWDADRANRLLIPLEACYHAALQLVLEFGLSNPFPNLSAAVRQVQEVKREMRLS